MTLQEKIDWILKRFNASYCNLYELLIVEQINNKSIEFIITRKKDDKEVRVEIPKVKIMKCEVVNFYHQLSDFVYIKFNK